MKSFRDNFFKARVPFHMEQVMFRVCSQYRQSVGRRTIHEYLQLPHHVCIPYSGQRGCFQRTNKRISSFGWKGVLILYSAQICCSLSTKVQLFDLSHVSTLLSYISNVIKDFIKLAQLIIRDHYQQRQTQVERQYTNFFSWRNSYYEMKCSTDNLKGENNFSFYVVCRKSCFQYTFVTENLSVGVAHFS